MFAITECHCSADYAFAAVAPNERHSHQSIYALTQWSEWAVKSNLLDFDFNLF